MDATDGNNVCWLLMLNGYSLEGNTYLFRRVRSSHEIQCFRPCCAVYVSGECDASVRVLRYIIPTCCTSHEWHNGNDIITSHNIRHRYNRHATHYTQHEHQCVFTLLYRPGEFCREHLVVRVCQRRLGRPESRTHHQYHQQQHSAAAADRCRHGTDRPDDDPPHTVIPDIWAEKFGSFEWINSIHEQTQVSNHVNGWEPNRLHVELHESKLSFASRIEFIHSKLSFFPLMYPGIVSAAEIVTPPASCTHAACYVGRQISTSLITITRTWVAAVVLPETCRGRWLVWTGDLSVRMYKIRWFKKCVDSDAWLFIFSLFSWCGLRNII